MIRNGIPQLHLNGYNPLLTFDDEDALWRPRQVRRWYTSASQRWAKTRTLSAANDSNRPPRKALVAGHHGVGQVAGEQLCGSSFDEAGGECRVG